MNKHLYIKKYILPILALMFVTSCIWKSYTKAILPIIKEALVVGDKKCVECHKKWYKNLEKSRHSVLFAENNGCETCHGSGSLHIALPKDKNKIFIFKGISSSDASQICLSCHQENSLEGYLDFKHFKKGVGCLGCHKMHGSREKKLLIKNEPFICFVCHPSVKKSFAKKYGHDIYNTNMLCNRCHGMHNSKKIVKDEGNTRDLCLGCHEVISDDVVVYHPPVENSCGKCHANHGSDVKDILVKSMPKLCYPCHDMKNHKVPIAVKLPMGPQGTNTCTSCHINIHGGHLNNFYDRMGPPGLIETNFVWTPDVKNIPKNAPILNIPNAPLKEDPEDFMSDEDF